MSEENPLSSSTDSSSKDEKLTLTSRKKWFWLGITIALLNPILSGLIIAFTFWTEPELKRDAKIIFALSLVWGVALIFLSSWLIRQGYLPR